ncbi:MAG: glycosyl hydrolase, partial [Lachnospiraceae bacterium]|nr:glycosyl hydrolase [Lachnospiraceae bacterium]
MKVKWIYSNEQAVWQEKNTQVVQHSNASLVLDGQEYQRMNGFGACFNELGYRALLHLPEQEQEKLLEEIFSIAEGKTGFTMCRLPIGGNDYSFDWYSLNETAGDFEMKHFSVERDKKALIPYIKRAQKYNQDLKFFASPWSPPTWMKNPPVYNWGKLITTPENLRAYADYFARFVHAYAAEGIHIDQVHVQNEPVANQKFPSCMWTGEELKIFIRDYLGPRFQEDRLSTEIWLGTINAPGCDYRRLIFDKWATEDYDY